MHLQSPPLTGQGLAHGVLTPHAATLHMLPNVIPHDGDRQGGVGAEGEISAAHLDQVRCGCTCSAAATAMAKEKTIDQEEVK